MKKLFLDRERIHKWMRRAATISAVLFIISLIGMLAGSTLPAQVEQETKLVNYEHNGRFDYLVYLKPSYLFGPEPQEPPEPPPSAKYPTVLIDSIDMSFRYETDLPLLQQVKQGVKIEAVLQNEDIWQKTIELVPVTDKTGNFKVEFELDLDDINELFDTIDEETEISTSSRELTIVATVGLGEHLESETLVQSLPITLSQNILEIGGELVKAVLDSTGGIEARGTFDYTIYLEENSLYKTDTLKPPEVTPYIPPQPKTLGVGPVIPYELVDRMDTSYYYDFRASRPVAELAEEVTITATIESPDLWSKTFVLVPSTRETGDFKVDFPVDIVYLNELLTAIRTETRTSGEAYNLIIEAFVHVTAQTDYGPIDEVFTQTLSTGRGGGTLIWNEELQMTQEGAITATNIIPNPNKYLGLSVSGVKNLSTALAGFFLLCFVGSLVLYVRLRPAELPWIEKEVARLRKKYGEIVAEATIDGEKTISVGSMKDLIKVANELGKPIIHQAPGKPQEPHAYYVFDGATRYQYMLVTKARR